MSRSIPNKVIRAEVVSAYPHCPRKAFRPSARRVVESVQKPAWLLGADRI
jgi:hypothetical protein